jgi:hypothetical protein
MMLPGVSADILISVCPESAFLALFAITSHAGFLLGLFLYPEDEGDVFLRNIG